MRNSPGRTDYCRSLTEPACARATTAEAGCCAMLPQHDRETNRIPPTAPHRAAAAQTGHFGCRSGLVEKDQPMRLKPHARLACGGPFLARRFDVGAVLLAR